MKLSQSFVLLICSINVAAQKMHYSINLPQPQTHLYRVQLNSSGWGTDTVDFKMPRWMPGYYQLINYAADVENITAQSSTGKTITLTKLNENTWRIAGVKNKAFSITYNINTKKNLLPTAMRIAPMLI